MEIGTERGFMHYDYEQFEKVITRSWVGELWKFLDSNEILIEGHIELPKRWYSSDIYIMEALYHNKRISSEQLQACNRCRQHLCVLTVSEMATADGKRIRESCMAVERDNIYLSMYEWPVQPRPHKQDRDIWRKCILMTLVIDEARKQLKDDLGHWNDWTKQLEWKWMYDKHDGTLFGKEATTWRAWQAQNSRTRGTSGNYSRTGWTNDNLPRGCVRCSIQPIREGVCKVTGIERVPQINTIDSEDEMVQGRIGDVSDALQRATDNHASNWVFTKNHTTWPKENGEDLAKATGEGKLVAIADGSHDRGRGTMAWLLAADNDEWSSAAPISRPGEIDADPYRSELGGLYGLMVALEILCRLHNIDQGSVTFSCDCDVMSTSGCHGT